MFKTNTQCFAARAFGTARRFAHRIMWSIAIFSGNHFPPSPDPIQTIAGIAALAVIHSDRLLHRMLAETRTVGVQPPVVPQGNREAGQI